MAIRLLITDYFVPEIIKTAKKSYVVTELYGAKPADLRAALAKTDIILCRSFTKLTRSVIQHAAEAGLKMIASAASGADHIDLKAAKEYGIVVVNTPHSVTVANAEFNIGTIIMLSRHFAETHANMINGIWDGEATLGHEIRDKRLGIVGFGKIGQLTAQYAQALGMKVSACDPYQTDEIFDSKSVDRENLANIMRISDFVSLSVPLTPETTGLIGKSLIDSMKQSAYLIQTSRGDVVDEEALIAALKNGRIAGTAIDVFANEPKFNPAFRELKNVFLTPHVACSTEETRYRGGICALEEMERFLKGDPLSSRVA